MPVIARFESGALPRAWGSAAGRALPREQPEDFQVEEQLGFEPAGQGEHVLLHLQKRGLTTRQLAREVARAAGLTLRDVGYCGMKDRDAVTSQWFSVGLSGRPEPDWSSLETPQSKVLSRSRHTRKLRRGAHQANCFTLLLRAIEGSAPRFEERLRKIEASGFPNYFGAQRFGTHGDNAQRAQAMLAGRLRASRGERGILLSALRAALFNRVLAARVASGTWHTPTEGDVLMLAGTHSVFAFDPNDNGVAARIAGGDVHVTGPLCGGARDALGELHEAEQAILAPFAGDLRALNEAGVQAARRALRAMAADLRWRWQGADRLELRFTLEPGVFATALVRELIAD